jgi:hypothetical protein
MLEAKLNGFLQQAGDQHASNPAADNESQNSAGTLS